MNTQIHAYRDLPAISAKLRDAFPEQATVGQLQTMPSNTHGTADPAGGADVSRSTLDPRREEIEGDGFITVYPPLRLDLKGAL